VDEAGAPEAFTSGSKLLLTRATDGKVTPSEVAKKLAVAKFVGVHSVPPKVISLTQATERGEVYSLEEIKAISTFKNEHKLKIHMDGSRFANALVSLNASPAEVTWKSGVDVMTIGATKNGAMNAECILFFDPEQAEYFEYRQKRSGQLFSKMRFYSAQLLAYFSNNLWLENAKHANEMAKEVAAIFEKVDGAHVPYKTQANIVFAQLPDAYVERLKQAKIGFHLWYGHADPDQIPEKLYRFVTSYQTSQDDINALKRI
jgi:threonine aldolase